MIMISHLAFVFNQGFRIYDIVITDLCVSIYDCHFPYEISYSHFHAIGNDRRRVDNIDYIQPLSSEPFKPQLAVPYIANRNKITVFFIIWDILNLSSEDRKS